MSDPGCGERRSTRSGAGSRRELLSGGGPCTREWLASYAWILGGALLTAGGYNLFIIPHEVVPGGMVGAAQLVHHALGWPIGLTALGINLPILLIASRIMGPGYGARTVLAMAAVSLCIDVLAVWRGAGAVIDDILVSTVFGGVIIGTGLAFIIRGRANAGGTSAAGSAVLPADARADRALHAVHRRRDRAGQRAGACATCRPPRTRSSASSPSRARSTPC